VSRSHIESSDARLRAPRPARADGCCPRSLDGYAHAERGRTLLALATSLVPFFALWTLMYYSLRVSYLLTLLLAVPTAGFVVRVYILFHDCAHGSLFRGKRTNAVVGACLALLVFTPFAQWRQDHAAHHATGSDLDRRGTGDVPTLTVAEYREKSWAGRLGYRLFRNPLIMFGLGPLYAMLIEPRWAKASAPARIKRSVYGTDLALVVAIGVMCVLVGWRAFLLVEAPLVPLAGGVGLWLFYVQHQFDATWWRRSPDWSFVDAALLGSSYLKLPRVLQFLTGNIGLHHVHHLNPKVPNYSLQRAHDETPVVQDVPQVTLWMGLRAVRLKLWDEDTGRMVTWAAARPSRTPLGARLAESSAS
jgi:omega-6 fatty acid desaturase (delta-12 desaturase)